MFKRKKKKTGIQTPKFNYTTPPPPPTSGSNAVKPNPNYVPPASIIVNCGHQPTYTSTQNPPNVFSSVTKPAKEKENKTMYALNLYIPFEELDTYIHKHIDEKYKDHTFMPIKVEVNELDLSIDIKLLSVSTVETDNCRYKLDLNALLKENKNEN